MLLRNRRGQSGLWGYGISGDLPIVLLQIGDADNIELVRQMVQAHAYWRLKGLAVDLVIWNEERDGYRQRLHEQIIGLIGAGAEAHLIDRPGGIFVRHADQIAEDDRILLQSVARAVVQRQPRHASPNRSTAARRGRAAPRAGSDAACGATKFTRPPPGRAAGRPRALAPRPATTGSAASRRRPRVRHRAAGRGAAAGAVGQRAGQPAFRHRGLRGGSAYTWCENAHELRLTPWHNDPGHRRQRRGVLPARRGERRLLVADLAARLPDRPGTAEFVARHGFGYSVFEHTADGIRAELTIFVAIDAAVKFSVLRLNNVSGGPRS